MRLGSSSWSCGRLCATRSLRALILTAALVAGCSPDATPPPWAFGPLPEQRFRLRADEQMVIDGEEVKIEKLADARLVLESREGARSELVLYLDRYYIHVQGGPAGETKMAFSEAGLITRGGPRGEVVLGPGQEAPGGGTVGDLLEKPLGGFFVGATGEASAPWRSYDPVLLTMQIVDWVLFSLPMLDPGASVWDGSRQVPTIGRYDLGIQLPLRFESRMDSDGETQRIRSSGVAQREDLRIAPGLEGKIRLDSSSETRLDPSGRVIGTQLELRMVFAGKSGTRVDSTHQVRLSCLDCGEAPEPAEPFEVQEPDEPDEVRESS
jgi:hypothetical protein